MHISALSNHPAAHHTRHLTCRPCLLRQSLLSRVPCHARPLVYALSPPWPLASSPPLCASAPGPSLGWLLVPSSFAIGLTANSSSASTSSSSSSSSSCHRRTLLLALTSAPLLRRSSTTLTLPFADAHIRAVLPSCSTPHASHHMPPLSSSLEP